MKISNTALISYLTCCFLTILASVFKFEGLMILAKPLIIPTLFFYYLSSTKNKVSVLICVFLFFTFIGDAVGLMNFKEEIKYILVPFFISNVAMVAVIVRNLEKFKFNLINVACLVITASFLAYAWFTIVDLLSGEKEVQSEVGFVGILVFILAVLGSYNVIWRTSHSNLFLLISISCVVISDVFYFFYNYNNQLLALNAIHIMCQVFSYFFFIKFALLAEENKLITLE